MVIDQPMNVTAGAHPGLPLGGGAKYNSLNNKDRPDPHKRSLQLSAEARLLLCINFQPISLTSNPASVVCSVKM